MSDIKNLFVFRDQKVSENEWLLKARLTIELPGAVTQEIEVKGLESNLLSMLHELNAKAIEARQNDSIRLLDLENRLNFLTHFAEFIGCANDSDKHFYAVELLAENLKKVSDDLGKFRVRQK